MSLKKLFIVGLPPSSSVLLAWQRLCMPLGTRRTCVMNSEFLPGLYPHPMIQHGMDSSSCHTSAL
eukprot:1850750-Amphidinium_carterae.1